MWRQVQEYKHALSYERSQNQKYLQENSMIRAVLYGIAGCANMATESEFLEAVKDQLTTSASPQFKQFMASLTNSSVSSTVIVRVYSNLLIW
jgi:hypothetical protein